MPQGTPRHKVSMCPSWLLSLIGGGLGLAKLILTFPKTLLYSMALGAPVKPSLNNFKLKKELNEDKQRIILFYIKELSG